MNKNLNFKVYVFYKHMTESNILEGDVEIALSVIQELEEEKDNASLSHENEYNFNDIYKDKNDEEDGEENTSCNLQDKIEKFKQFIVDEEKNHHNTDTASISFLYKMIKPEYHKIFKKLIEKLEESTLSKKEKIKILLCGIYLLNSNLNPLYKNENPKLKELFDTNNNNNEIDAHLISNQHLQAGLKELEKLEKNDDTGNKIFDASNYDHKLVYILHNVIL
jgi:hypothetical protein